MNDTSKKAAYLIQQAKKYRALKTLVNEGIADIEAGRVAEWNLGAFLWRARNASA